MRSNPSLQDLHLERSIVTIGSFDGVHAGHQAILTHVVKEARRLHSQSAVITFFPHPAVVLKKISVPFYLTNPEERCRLIRDLGIDNVITLEFDQKMAGMLPEEFVGEINDHLGLLQLWVGHDFALGRNRVGDYNRLKQIGTQMGFSVRTLPPVLIDNQLVSSSEIRNALANGKIPDANRMMGRAYTVTGVVIKGDGRGKKMGIPTANLSVWDQQLLPMNGIYAGWTIVDGETLPSVANLGLRPTFENDASDCRLEIHILDFGRDLYGKTLSFDFITFLRPEIKFASIEKLIDQIKLDIENTRRELTHATKTPGLSARPSSSNS